MSEHYYSKSPKSKRSPKTWTYHLKGNDYTFTSDVGVFSKDEVDFGSRLLIEQFQLPPVEGALLDMGCGYGPIGIALAAQFKDREIVMADVNERALQLAKENAKLNDVTNVSFANSDGFSTISTPEFAAIVTNPPIRAGKKVIYKMFEESKRFLCNQGELWIVIQKKQGAPSAKEKLEGVFGNVELVGRSKGYYILKSVMVDQSNSI
ncbi:class I SAM-dependent methyltransferase [Virgibacillus sp. W0430]|uniref:class I SAM-dependent methyltransferase n=1 Tax=Virgibacillus sp. W0430 TaxID=3391580 RepID=UPI003F47CC8A